MGTITKWNVFFVLVASLALTVSVGGIRPSPAFGCEYLSGWMTGGGSIFEGDVAYGGQVAADGRVTHGFVVHCTQRHSDNLEIVDHVTGLNFHLTELISASCSDDPAIDPNPPDAAFDTFEGGGIGRCKLPSSPHSQPCHVFFTFTDGGERGGCLRDTARILITDDASGATLLDIVSGDLDCGNHQAHDGF